MKEVILGFDLGIASCGWSILDKNDESIIDYGVSIYKEGKSKEEKRVFRGQSRRRNRIRVRVKRLENLYKSNNLKFNILKVANIEEIKVKGLKEKIEFDEITTILNNGLRKRGYIPYDYDVCENKFKDDNPEKCKNKYPCEIKMMIFKEYGKIKGTENKFESKDIINEIIAILENQKKYYKITSEFIEEYKKIFLTKRKFYEGPGSEKSFTKYGRFRNEKDLLPENKVTFLYERQIKNCSIYLNEKTVPRESFPAQLFNIYNDLINIKIESNDNNDHLVNSKYFNIEKNEKYYYFNNLGIEYFIEKIFEQKAKKIKNKNISNIFSKHFEIDKIEDIGLKKIKNEFSITEFNLIRIIVEKLEFKKTEIKELLYNTEKQNEIDKLIEYLVLVPMNERNDEQIKAKFKIKDDVLKKIQEIKNSNVSNYHRYSKKAITRYLKIMKRELINSSKASYEYKNEIKPEVFENLVNNYFEQVNSWKMQKNFTNELFASPTVKKSLNKAINILNEIIKFCKKNEYVICQVNIESARELLSESKKKEYENENFQHKQIKKEFEEAGYIKKDIIKERLLEETDNKCIYCDKILNSEIMQIDHILPISLSADDSFTNKIASCNECNNKKNQKTAYSFSQEKMGIDKYVEKIKVNTKISQEKKQKLLYSKDINIYKRDFIARNLRDTAYITNEFKKQIKIYKKALERYNKIESVVSRNLKINSIPPILISGLREKMKINKERNNNFHHAVDAILIAYITKTPIGKILQISQNDPQGYKFLKNINDIVDEKSFNFGVLSNNICDEIRKVDQNNTKFLYEVQKKENTSFWDQTIVKVRKNKESLYRVKKKNIYELESEEFLNKSGKNNYLIQKYDVKGYEWLLKIVKEYKNTKYPFKEYCLEQNKIINNQFNENIHGIRIQNKKNRPIIKSLQYYGKSINFDDTYLGDNHKYMRDKLSIVHIEFYQSKITNEYKLFPIYNIFYNKNKNNKEHPFYKKIYKKVWKNINEIDYEYKFNLISGQIVEIKLAPPKKGGEEKIIEGQYKFFDKSDNRLSIEIISQGNKTQRIQPNKVISIKIIPIYNLGRKFKI